MRNIFSILIAITCLFAATSYGATINVPDDYSTIQAAINASSNGDLILVEADTYTENIDFLGKEITLQSEDGAATTIIDGGENGSVVTCDSGEDEDSVLDGFTITNGTGTDVSGDSWGGGMYNSYSDPTVINCIFSGNEADFGGGMSNSSSSPTVTDCTFTGNESNKGGGMKNISSSSPTVTNCIFTNNSVTDYSGGDGLGGGMYNGSSSPTVTNCTFSGNSAEHSGGGMYNGTSAPAVTNCTFFENTADYGGGMLNKGSTSPAIINCTFSENSATSDPNYSGGGIYNWNGSTPTITNCILWNDSPDEIYIYSGSPTVTYSDIDGGYTGTGNINSDPLFVDGANGDFHIKYTSPCKDAGNNTPVTESYDFEGDPRISYTTVDMGVDEFYTHLYIVDDTLYFVGVPDDGVYLSYGYNLLSTPTSTAYGPWYLDTPYYGPYTMDDIPATGILTFEFNNSEIPSGTLYLQALIGNTLTNYCELIIE